MKKTKAISIKNGIKLINASLIEMWNIQNRRVFEGLFPEIIKKLIIESTGGEKIQNLSIPSGDLIWMTGIDGQLLNFNNNIDSYFIPYGKIIIEIGSTQKNALGKIKSDFNKRNASFPDEDKKKTTFIIISSKTLNKQTKEAFCEENKGNWLALKIYDALDLELWFEQCLQTSIYFLEKMSENKKINLNSLEGAWKIFKNRTKPELSLSLFTTGRDDNIEKLKRQLENTKIRSISIRANSREEAYGFVLSVLYKFYNNNSNLLIINDIETFENVNKIVKNKILIMNFNFEQFDLSIHNRFIILFGNDDSENQKYDITLSLRSFHNLSKCMEEDMNISYEMIDKLRKKCGTNSMSIIREIKSDNYIPKINWRTNENLKDLIPLIFLGQIDKTNKKDISILQRILKNEKVDDYLEKILVWKKVDDSPILFYKNIIKINSKEELWNELKDLIVSKYKNVQELIKFMFNEYIKKSDNNEIDNNIFTNINLYYSKYIYRNLLETLILYSIKENSLQYNIDQTIKEILSSIKNLDNLKHASEYFPLLAECSPKEFIEYCNNIISNEKTLVVKFLSANNKDLFISGNEYTNLLYALKILSYLKEYKIKACYILVELYLFDIKYLLENSPKNCLINCLSFLNTGNAFSNEEKIDFLLAIIEKYGENVFDLCIDIITSDNILLSSSVLKWREADISEHNLTTQCRLIGIEKVIIKILEKLDSNQTKIFCKILNYYNFFTKQIFEDIKCYVKLKFQNDEDKSLIYEYIFKKIKIINKFGERDKNKYYTDFFKQLLELVTPKDIFLKNSVYFTSYELDLNDENIDEFKKRYNSMKTEYNSDELVKKISISLKNNWWNGEILSEILTSEEIEISFNFLLNKKHFHILSSLLCHIYKNKKIDTINLLNSISRENLEKIITIFGSHNVIEFNNKILKDEKLCKLYWENRSRIISYNDEEFNQIKKFNPLLYIYYLNHKVDFKLWNISEILYILKNNISNQIKKQDIYIESLKDVLHKINNNIYNLEVVTVSFKFYQLCFSEKIFKSIKVFLFENPQYLLKFLSNKNEFSFIIGIEYYFPDNFEENTDLLENFCKEFWNYESKDELNKNYILQSLGQIFARSTKLSSDLFIPLCLRKIIEKFKNKEIRKGFVIGHLNAIGVKTVDDGKNDRDLAKKYREKVFEIEINFPETAEILISIAEQYESEANNLKKEDLIGNRWI